MSAKRFKVTGREGPIHLMFGNNLHRTRPITSSCLFVCFHFIVMFRRLVLFCHRKSSVQADEKVGSMQLFWVNSDNPSRPGDSNVNPLVMTTPFGSRCFATMSESIECQQHIAQSTSRKAEAAQSYKPYLLLYMILTEAQFSFLPQRTEIPPYLPKSTVYFSCWKILEGKFRINPLICVSVYYFSTCDPTLTFPDESSSLTSGNIPVISQCQSSLPHLNLLM